MSWLVRERPDLRCDFAINEGGGYLLDLKDGRRVVTVSIGEKRVTSVRIRIKGRAGHASIPDGADNVLGRVATAIQALLAAEAPASMHPAVGRSLRELGAPDASDDELLAWGASQHPILAGLLSAMTRLTVTPTGTATYEPSNVIPPFADVVCDCRALPEQSEDDIRTHVERALGNDFSYELELLEPLEGGTESPIDTDLYRACESYVAERLPGATLLPLIDSGFTDSHWVRSALGTTAYGFAPVFSMDLETYLGGMHGADECLDVADLVEMTEFNLHAIRALGEAR
jgi:acetylornithine deacetylase/succinyl-diaminopimelate desuccinylase-like protein